MEKQYQLVRIVERKNKENKTYYLAFVLFNRENDSDLLKILLPSNLVDDFSEFIGTEDDDITKYIKVEYNSYSKTFQPKITM